MNNAMSRTFTNRGSWDTASKKMEQYAPKNIDFVKMGSEVVLTTNQPILRLGIQNHIVFKI